MNEIERAIEHYSYGVSHDIFSEPVTTYAKLAAAALREQAEREKGLIKCETCGNKIGSLAVNIFNRDGSDSFYPREIVECPEDAICVDVDLNWTGNGLSHDEMLETIQCPHCGNFPFQSTEIQTVELIRVVLFRDSRRLEVKQDGD